MPKKKQGSPVPVEVRAALSSLRDEYGGCRPLANAIGIHRETLMSATLGENVVGAVHAAIVRFLEQRGLA